MNVGHLIGTHCAVDVLLSIHRPLGPARSVDLLWSSKSPVAPARLVDLLVTAALIARGPDGTTPGIEPSTARGLHPVLVRRTLRAHILGLPLPQDVEASRAPARNSSTARPKLGSREAEYAAVGIDIIGVTLVTKSATDERASAFLSNNGIYFPFAKLGTPLSLYPNHEAWPTLKTGRGAVLFVRRDKIAWAGLLEHVPEPSRLGKL